LNRGETLKVYDSNIDITFQDDDLPPTF
jgi:hypothetical protein